MRRESVATFSKIYRMHPWGTTKDAGNLKQENRRVRDGALTAPSTSGYSRYGNLKELLKNIKALRRCVTLQNMDDYDGKSEGDAGDAADALLMVL